MTDTITKEHIKPTLDATPATVAVGGNASDLVIPDGAHIASDGHVYDEIPEYIDHGSQNNVDGEDLGNEECDVPVVTSAQEEENNEGPEHNQSSTIADDSNRHYPPGTHAIVRHGSSMKCFGDDITKEDWLKYTNLISDEIEVSKKSLEEIKQKLKDQENKLKDEENRWMREKSRDDKAKEKLNKSNQNDTDNEVIETIKSSSNLLEQLNDFIERHNAMLKHLKPYYDYWAKSKEEEFFLKELQDAFRELTEEHHDKICKLANQLDDFRVQTLTMPHTDAVFVSWDVGEEVDGQQKSGIIMHRRLQPPRPTDPIRYFTFILADGTGTLKAGAIVTAYEQGRRNFKKSIKKNEKNKKDWINLSNKTVKEFDSCTQPGIYILKDTSSDNSEGLERLFPYWKIF